MLPAAVMMPTAVVLGSLTIPGRPEQVSRARAYVAALAGAAAETAALLTSELVTNAVLHTRSGRDGGTVTVVVIGRARTACWWRSSTTDPRRAGPR